MSSAPRKSRCQWAGVVLGGMLVSSALLSLALAGTARELHQRGALGVAYVSTFSHAKHPLEAILAKGDGQAYAGLAQVADLRQPGGFGTKTHLSLRAGRPLLAYLSWSVAFGRPRLLPRAQAVVVVVTSGLAALAAGEWLRRRGRSRWLGLGLLLLPGAVVSQMTLTSEVLGLGLAIVGLISRDDGSDVLAVLAFCAAGLARETYLLVPGALVCMDIFRRRLSARTAILVVTPAVWIAWMVFVRVRLDLPLFPLSSPGDLGTPLTGVRVLFDYFTGISRPGDMSLPGAVGSLIETLATAAMSVAMLTRLRRFDSAVWAAGAFSLLAVILGSNVWIDPTSQARLLLPLYFFGVAALLSPAPVPDVVPAGVERSRQEDRSF